MRMILRALIRGEWRISGVLQRSQKSVGEYSSRTNRPGIASCAVTVNLSRCSCNSPTPLQILLQYIIGKFFYPSMSHYNRS
jgi:hypothetical protein